MVAGWGAVSSRWIDVWLTVKPPFGPLLPLVAITDTVVAVPGDEASTAYLEESVPDGVPLVGTDLVFLVTPTEGRTSLPACPLSPVVADVLGDF